MRMQDTKDVQKLAMRLMVALMVLAAFAMSGCIFWRPVTVVPHPDAPVFVTEVRRRYYRIAVYDKASNKLIDAGWTPIRSETLVGRTISKFDWEAHIAKRGEHGNR